MLSEHGMSGELGQCEEPDWQPLIDLVGIGLTGWFMWMTESNSTTKHGCRPTSTAARAAISISPWMAGAYAYVPRGRYREIDRQEAINVAFACWKNLCPQEDHDAIRAALRRARRAETVRARKAATQER